MGITAGAVTAAAAVAGAAVSAYGAMSSAQAQSKEASYQGQIAANNAKIAEQNRAYAIAAGETKAQSASLTASARLGAVRAAEAANDIDVNTGSAVDVQKSQREVGELDTLTTMNNALLTAYGYQTQATSFTAQAGLDKFSAGQIAAGGDIAAAGDLLSSAKSVAGLFPETITPSVGSVSTMSTQTNPYTY